MGRLRRVRFRLRFRLPAVVSADQPTVPRRSFLGRVSRVAKHGANLCSTATAGRVRFETVMAGGRRYYARL
jgi:hypothetical protein